MEDNFTREELSQRTKIVAVNRIARGILRKWRRTLIVSFLSMAAGFSVFLVWHFAKSLHRFDATVRLQYSPRKVDGVDNVTEKELMAVLERASLKRRTARLLGLHGVERQSIIGDLMLEQSYRPANMFTITAYSASWKGAVKKANMYASVLTNAYAQYRTPSLEKQIDAIQNRRNQMADRIAKTESQENLERAKTGVAAPEATLVQLNSQLSDQRNQLMNLRLRISNDEARIAKHKGNKGELGRKIAANAKSIKAMAAEIDAIDKDLAKLREQKTDEHPLVVAKLAERATAEKLFNDFLRKNGLSSVPLSELSDIEAAVTEYEALRAGLESLQGERKTLERAIAENEKKTEALNAAIPSLDRLRVQRTVLEQTMRKLDDEQDSIHYLIRAIPEDFRIIEEASGAGDRRPVSTKNIALAIAGACAGTFVICLWILTVEFFLGNVKDSKELAAWEDIEPLGTLPEPGVVPEEEEKDILGVVAQEFLKIDLPKGVVLVCRFHGAPEQPAFAAVLDWSFAMAGRKCFTLKIVSGAEFNPPEGAEPLVSAVKKGKDGWFPAENRFSLAPTELEMLHADIATLRQEYDTVFIMMPDGLRKGGSFFKQLLDVCESVLVEAGSGKTPRAELKYARKYILASGKPAMGLMVGASAAEARAEMEA